MGMKFTSKLNGTLVIQPQLCKLVQGMPGITRSTNAQEGFFKNYIKRQPLQGLAFSYNLKQSKAAPVTFLPAGSNAPNVVFP
eukprot:1134274-Pelagomonas_calceolata.AAC.1